MSAGDYLVNWSYGSNNTWDPHNSSGPIWVDPNCFPSHNSPADNPPPWTSGHMDIPTVDDEDWYSGPYTWTPDMCVEKRHRLYHATGLPCPCKEIWEQERCREMAEKMARRARKIREQNPNPYVPNTSWITPYTADTTTDNTSGYSPWCGNSILVQ